MNSRVLCHSTTTTTSSRSIEKKCLTCREYGLKMIIRRRTFSLRNRRNSMQSVSVRRLSTAAAAAVPQEEKRRQDTYRCRLIRPETCRTRRAELTEKTHRARRSLCSARLMQVQSIGWWHFSGDSDDDDERHDGHQLISSAQLFGVRSLSSIHRERGRERKESNARSPIDRKLVRWRVSMLLLFFLAHLSPLYSHWSSDRCCSIVSVFARAAISVSYGGLTDWLTDTMIRSLIVIPFGRNQLEEKQERKKRRTYRWWRH